MKKQVIEQTHHSEKGRKLDQKEKTHHLEELRRMDMDVNYPEQRRRMNQAAQHPEQRRRIIVADDDKEIVTVLTMMLEDAGYEVKSTANGHTARMVSDYLPDLLLLDIWMASVDGRDVCKFLKKHKPTKHIPIIMISANQDTKRIANEAGADDFIAKPFDMVELLTKVAQYV